MEVSQALRQRKSTRAFLEREVEEEQIEAILEVARCAPSGVNTQPWQVAVVKGESKARLTEAMEQAFRSGVKGEMDYRYYPLQWHNPYRERRKQCGLQLYQALEIGREDVERRQDQWAANYRAFDAPVILFFFLDGALETGSFLDYGMFIQSVMLAAVEAGLATCPQAALAEYPQIVKQQLGYPPESILLVGMAVGYEDTTAAINCYRTQREPVKSFTSIFQ